MIAPLSASSSALAQQQQPQQQTHSDGDSDSDWDDDDDFVAKKINIKIKPITQMTPGKISASMDELRATVGTWKSMGNINLVKPNSRRSQYIQHQPAPLLQAPNRPPPATNPDQQQHLLPVALAVQECLNVRTLLGPNGESSTSLIGHVKMAVPRKIIEMNLSQFENNDLILDMSTSRAWSEFQLNDQFVRRLLPTDDSEHQPGNMTNGEFYLNGSSSKSSNGTMESNQAINNTAKLSVNMKSVYSYSKDLYQRQPVSTYFLLPELLNYKIVRSLKQQQQEEPVSNGYAHLINDDLVDPCLNPIEPVAHWLCDLSVTKVRIDMECLEEKLNACGIAPGDVKNIKIILRVNGGVESQQSKPPAVWSPIDSKLSWSFSDLNELIRCSTLNGVTSCLAKFNLNDGPSTPDDMEIQFSIMGKTLSGTQITLDSKQSQEAKNSYLITKRKFEVRTGRFKCEPPHVGAPLSS